MRTCSFVGASGNYLSPLPDNSYLMDAITKLEMSNKEYTFVFVRLFWTVPLSKFPTTATHIIFSQVREASFCFGIFGTERNDYI